MAGLFGSIASAFSGFFTKPATVKPTDTVGTSGTAIFGGYIQSREKNPDLQGQKQFETFSDNVVNNATVGAVVRRSLDLIAGAKWKLVPPKDLEGEASIAQAENIASTVEMLLFKRMKSTPWHRVTRKTASFRLIGFSIQEPTAVKYDDGLIGWAEIAARPQQTIERWDVDPETGQVVGVTQRSPQTFAELYLPRTKMVYAHDDSLTDSPAGVGLFRHTAESVRTLKVLEQLEGNGFQSDIAGTPIGRVPLDYLNKQVGKNGFTAADRDRAVAGIRNIVENHLVNPKLGLMLDSATYPNVDGSPGAVPMFGFELASATGKNLAALDVAINRKCREIARVFSAEFMLMGGDGAGSLAQHRDKTAAYAQSLNALLTELAWTYDLDVIAPLCRLNGWPEELWPELVPDPIQFEDVALAVQAIQGMATAGATLDPEDEIIDDIRESLGQRRRAPEIMQRIAEEAAMPPAPPFNPFAPHEPEPTPPPKATPPDPAKGEVDISVNDMAGEGDAGQDGDKE